jgi:hypothetical protein
MISDIGPRSCGRHSLCGCRRGSGTQPRRSSGQIRYPKICFALASDSTSRVPGYWPVLGDYRGCIRRSPECQHGRHGVSRHLFAGPTGPGQTAFLRRVLSRTEYKRQSLLLLNPGNGPAPVAGTKISSEHLDLITDRPDSGRAPGNRFALVFEVKPGPGIHVYAPGASGHRVVSLAIIRQPIVRVLPIKYPASEIYFFRPLASANEGAGVPEAVHVGAGSDP